jgi:hypothetical protein
LAFTSSTDETYYITLSDPYLSTICLPDGSYTPTCCTGSNYLDTWTIPQYGLSGTCCESSPPILSIASYSPPLGCIMVAVNMWSDFYGSNGWEGQRLCFGQSCVASITHTTSTYATDAVCLPPGSYQMQCTGCTTFMNYGNSWLIPDYNIGGTCCSTTQYIDVGYPVTSFPTPSPAYSDVKPSITSSSSSGSIGSIVAPAVVIPLLFMISAIYIYVSRRTALLAKIASNPAGLVGLTQMAQSSSSSAPNTLPMSQPIAMLPHQIVVTSPYGSPSNLGLGYPSQAPAPMNIQPQYSGGVGYGYPSAPISVPMSVPVATNLTCPQYAGYSTAPSGVGWNSQVAPYPPGYLGGYSSVNLQGSDNPPPYHP